MAAGGRSQKNVIHIHIHNSSNEETIVQEQHVGDRTEIRDSNIGSVIAGQSGQGEEQDAPGEDEEDIAEGVEQVNFAKKAETSVPKHRKSFGKRKVPPGASGDDGFKTSIRSKRRRVNKFRKRKKTDKTGRLLKSGALQISDVLSLLEKEPISTSSRVFRAILHSDVTGDKKVVAKITPADEKHQREAKIHFSVPHHKNIVERIITNTFDFRGQPSIYIAMESCDCSLDDHVKSQVKDRVPFDSQKYLSISRQIVVALNFLHSHKIVHGDLKPGNVLLLVDKNLVKLCDFGLSRAISDDKTSTQLTSPQGGTTGWQAPEVLTGTTKIGFASDIFPLGLVTFHCLSYGKHPYGDKSYSWNHYIVEGENRNLDGMLIANAGSAKVLLESMLQRNSADRPTAEEVLKHPLFASEEKDSEMKPDCGKTGQGMSDEKKLKVSSPKGRTSEHPETSKLLDDVSIDYTDRDHWIDDEANFDDDYTDYDNASIDDDYAERDDWIDDDVNVDYTDRDDYTERDDWIDDDVNVDCTDRDDWIDDD